MIATVTHCGKEFASHVKTLRTAKRLSQSDLAARTGITRLAVSAIESNVYLSTVGVALRLAAVLDCPVEALFSLSPPEDLIEGIWVGASTSLQGRAAPLRVKVSAVGKKTIVRPVTGLGEVLAYAVPADGYLVNEGSVRPGESVRVRLSRDRRAIEQEISVAGCDPAIFLAGEHLRRQKDETTVVGWIMGSMAALRVLQRGEVHVAGLHLYDHYAQLFDLYLGPLRATGYDLVVPKAYLTIASDASQSFETFLSRAFRNEIEALGGYDTRDTATHQTL